MSENPTKKDIEELAKLASEKLGFSTLCKNCGHPMHLEVFWFDINDRPYRVCPNCNTLQYEE